MQGRLRAEGSESGSTYWFLVGNIGVYIYVYIYIWRVHRDFIPLFLTKP